MNPQTPNLMLYALLAYFCVGLIYILLSEKIIPKVYSGKKPPLPLLGKGGTIALVVGLIITCVGYLFYFSFKLGYFVGYCSGC